MFSLNKNIFDKWAANLPEFNDKGILLSIAKSQVRDFTLSEAVNFIKGCINDPKTCCKCGKKTAYVHGIYRGNQITEWHCILTCKN